MELVQHCDVSAHAPFQISKIKALIEDPASRKNVASFKKNHLGFVLVYQSKKEIKDFKIHQFRESVSSNAVVQRHFKTAANVAPRLHRACFRSAEGF